MFWYKYPQEDSFPSFLPFYTSPQMARLLSRAFALRRSFLNIPLPVHAEQAVPILTSLIRPNRTASRSIHSGSGQFIEVDMESPSDSESEALMIKKLDDLVRRILVLKSTPDWLPFIPGSSFWVPPRISPMKLVDLVEKLADQLSDEETLALISGRGWPSSQFFLKGTLILSNSSPSFW